MLELTEMIRGLRREVIEATAAGSGQLVRFEFGPVEIEAPVTVPREGDGSGKVRFWVIEAGTDGQYGQATTQRIAVTLHPKTVSVDETTQTALISGTKVPRER